MRTSIVIALAIASSLAITACGNGHKAKVAAAKITGDKKAQAGNVDEITNDINQKNAELKNIGFGGLDDVGTVSGVINNVKGYDANQQKQIKEILGEVKSKAEALIKAGKDLKDAKNEEQKAKGEKAVADGEKFKQRAMAGIEKMNQQEKK